VVVRFDHSLLLLLLLLLFSASPDLQVYYDANPDITPRHANQGGGGMMGGFGGGGGGAPPPYSILMFGYPRGTVAVSQRASKDGISSPHAAEHCHVPPPD